MHTNQKPSFSSLPSRRNYEPWALSSLPVLNARPVYLHPRRRFLNNDNRAVSSQWTHLAWANSIDPDQTLWRLVWICSVCQYSFYGTLGINGLSWQTNGSIWIKDRILDSNNKWRIAIYFSRNDFYWPNCLIHKGTGIVLIILHNREYNNHVRRILQTEA